MTLFSRLRLLPFLGALALPLHATQYYFGNWDVTLSQADGSAWTSETTIQLGKFADGFLPTTANVNDWFSHWLSTPAASGYYDPSGPEWSAALDLVDNAVFNAGDQFYLWVFDSSLSPTGELALFTDASWLGALNSSEDYTSYSFDFTRNTEALWGSVDLSSGLAYTAPLQTRPVPDLTSWEAWALCLALLVGCTRRKRRATAQMGR